MGLWNVALVKMAGDASVAPSRKLTRSQFAQDLMRFCDLVEVTFGF
jgi:hypothetical protein